mmetsp:Transcript_46406/g.63201  ORF Transcript_46406/g.63201 Transcript_46406/m.63201 type:complete len:106 (+) Transcript_46406:860-1177(+)
MHTFRETILLGSTELTKAQIYDVVAELKGEWLGKDYSFFSKNCCNFCVAFAEKLSVNGSVKPPPVWIHHYADLVTEEYLFAAHCIEDLQEDLEIGCHGLSRCKLS